MVKKNKNIWVIVSVVVAVAVLSIAFSHSGLLGTKTFVGGLNSMISSPVGYFRFGNDATLDQTYLKNAYVRVGLIGVIDSDGNIAFDPEGTQGKVIAKLIADGKKVVPTIRIKASGDAKCDIAPSDLDRTSALSPGNMYSEKVKIFAYSLAEAYKGKFPIVVFGNEQNSEGFFCATKTSGDKKSTETIAASDYIRMFSTVKKAYQEKDPQAKFADGGLQGQPLGWLVIDDYVDKGDTAKALDFHKKLMGESVDVTTLKAKMAKVATQQAFMRAKALIGFNLYSFGDIVNIHHYQPPESIFEIDKFVKARAGGKPRMTNELGIKQQFGESSRTIPMKFFEFASRGYGSIIWFSLEGDDGFNAGALVDDAGNLHVTNVKAFEMMAKFLGRPYSSIKNLSTDTMGKVALTYPNGSNVEVLWPIGALNLTIPTIAKNCITYSHLGERLPGDKKTWDTPVYIACEPATTPTPTATPRPTATPTPIPTRQK